MATISCLALVALFAAASGAAAAAQDRTRPFERIGIGEVRKQGKLAPVVVAVIDTAVSRAGLKLVPGPHGTSDLSPNPDSHGSRVAGILADRRPERLGVAPNAVILPVRVFDDAHLGQDAPIAAALRYAVDHGARVVNVSASARRQPELNAAVAYATSKGVLIVVAAGNPALRGLDARIACSSLATHPDVLAVAATDISEKLAPAHSRNGAAVDLAAPAAVFPAAGEHSITGTSFAAPVVSGAAALLLGRDPSLSRVELAERLLGSARKGHGTPEQVGHGVVDLEALLTSDRRVAWTKHDRGCTLAADADPWDDAAASVSPARSFPPAAAVYVGLAGLLLAGLAVNRRRVAARQTA